MCGGGLLADVLHGLRPCRALSASDLWPDLPSSSKLNVDNIEFFPHPHDYSIKRPQNTSSGNGQEDRTFNTTEKAVRAYDREACKICGKTAKVNFPNEDDTITLRQYHHNSTLNHPCYLLSRL